MLKYIIFCCFFLFFLELGAENISDVKLSDLIQLNKEEIITKLVNKKLSGVYEDETKFFEIHYANGNYYTSDETSEYDGKWKIVNNQMCYLYNIDEEFTCVNVMVNSMNEFFYVHQQDGVYAKITNFEENLQIDESEYLHPPMDLLIINNELFYTGDILITTYDKINSILKKNKNIEILVIDSFGGDMGTAEDIADLIIDYNLDTRVKSYCYSACTIIFLGGENRMLDRGGKIGFHQTYYLKEDLENWYNNIKDEYENIYAFIAWFHEDTQKDIFDNMQFFLERGVNPYFAIKSMQASSDSMWYPRRKEMLDANFITE